MTKVAMGIYEKALPKALSWPEKFSLAKELGFTHIELSIGESEERLKRLDWSKQEKSELVEAMQKTGVTIQNLMLSGHRRFPLGTTNLAGQKKSIELLEKAVDLAVGLGIRNIQLAGYDVFYEEKSLLTREFFIENLQTCVNIASNKGVMLSIETMDDPFIHSITKIKQIKQEIKSPWLQVYPDLGNISAWPENDVAYELEQGIDTIVSIHLKDTLAVTDTFLGQFKHVRFGSGVVDFEGCLRVLKRLNYHGSFTIEIWNEDEEDPVQKMREAKKFFDELFEKVGWLNELIGGKKC